MYKNVFILIKRALNEQKKADIHSDVFQDQKSSLKFELNQFQALIPFFKWQPYFDN